MLLQISVRPSAWHGVLFPWSAGSRVRRQEGPLPRLCVGTGLSLGTSSWSVMSDEDDEMLEAHVMP